MENVRRRRKSELASRQLLELTPNAVGEPRGDALIDHIDAVGKNSEPVVDRNRRPVKLAQRWYTFSSRYVPDDCRIVRLKTIHWESCSWRTVLTLLVWADGLVVCEGIGPEHKSGAVDRPRPPRRTDSL